ncbi:MAG TPA: CoA transferase [Tepidiformaceae bacterium]|nr:CoA transferase [Tepidiformaceae bacterium]
MNDEGPEAVIVRGPFSGLRVLELGRFIAAPYCGQLLADGGADVIKVEALIGDETRRNGAILPTEGRQFLNKNRGKRSLAFDLGDAGAREVVRRLALRADVLIANFRPGDAARLGLDYAGLAEHNPRLIYAENTAYGHDGPMAHATGMDLVMQAYSGIATPTGAGPIPNESPIIDYAAALLLAWGVSTALYHRERTGAGQRLDTSLLQAALVLQNNSMNHIDITDGWRDEFVEYLKHAFADGLSWAEVLERRRALQPHAPIRAYYGFLSTADGAIAVAAGTRPLRARMLELLGLEDRWVSEPGWEPPDAHGHADEMTARVEERLRTKTTAHWCAEFDRLGIPAAPVQLREQLLDDAQARANGYFVRLEHELVGGVTVVAPPVRFSASPLRVSKASPTLGAHTRAILAEAGLDDAAVDSLIERGAVAQWQ